ncbi:hypothetical protein V8C40DRAFT_213631 [Trichoderma camerunense]|nr:hypothetical protein CI102_9493 [Trichoderma harzianum]
MRLRSQTALSLAIGGRETQKQSKSLSACCHGKIVSMLLMWLLCRAPIGGWHGTTKRGLGADGRSPLAPGPALCAASNVKHTVK